MTDLESKVERDNEALRISLQRKMEELDAALNKTLQRALDNPLAN
jgi:hypothetical protein